MGLYDYTECPCGSGKLSWWEVDKNGRALRRVCVLCFETKMKTYNIHIISSDTFKRLYHKDRDEVYEEWMKRDPEGYLDFVYDR